MTTLQKWCDKFLELVRIAESFSDRLRALKQPPIGGDPSERLRCLVDLRSKLVSPFESAHIELCAEQLRRVRSVIQRPFVSSVA
jgi:hypothetical protein